MTQQPFSSGYLPKENENAVLHSQRYRPPVSQQRDLQKPACGSDLSAQRWWMKTAWSVQIQPREIMVSIFHSHFIIYNFYVINNEIISHKINENFLICNNMDESRGNLETKQINKTGS